MPIKIPNELWLPTLKTFTRSSWKTFKLEWESYVLVHILKGGDVPLCKLFSSQALPILALRLRNSTYKTSDGTSAKIDLSNPKVPDAALVFLLLALG